MCILYIVYCKKSCRITLCYLHAVAKCKAATTLPLHLCHADPDASVKPMLQTRAHGTIHVTRVTERQAVICKANVAVSISSQWIRNEWYMVWMVSESSFNAVFCGFQVSVCVLSFECLEANERRAKHLMSIDTNQSPDQVDHLLFFHKSLAGKHMRHHQNQSSTSVWYDMSWCTIIFRRRLHVSQIFGAHHHLQVFIL